ncbi:hypothetical protein C3L33_19434, partial [Rhododendron williamsianum]
MSSSQQQTLGGPSQCGRILGPSLDKIIKNVAWRKHSNLVSASKSALDKLQTLTDSAPDPLSPSPLLGLVPADAELVLHPLLLALDSASPKVVEPALDCVSRLFSHGLFRCEIDLSPSLIASRLIASVCKCAGAGEEAVELGVLKVLLSAVRSPCVLIRGDCLVHVEDSLVVGFNTVSVSDLLEFTDRNLNEGSSVQFVQNFINEIVQVNNEGVVVDSKISMRVESTGEGKEGLGNGESNDGVDSGGGSKITEDGFMVFKNLCKLSMKYSSQENPDDQILLRGKILSLELLKAPALGSAVGSIATRLEMVQMGVHCRIWSNEWAERKDFWDEPDSLAFCRGVHGGIRDLAEYISNMVQTVLKAHVESLPDEAMILNIRLMLDFKFLRYSYAYGSDVFLEMTCQLPVVIGFVTDCGGFIPWFLNAIKQYLCLSLLKNSALSVMTIFQLLCSIFKSLLSKFRSALKSEIGIFFPMLILRVLENVLQPSFLQKMTVLNLLEKISQDSQIIVDIFVNYDCDVDAPNIFERTVNGLLKTAIGPPPGSTTTLSPAQDVTFRLESVKCLVTITKSMGSWMDQQLRIGDFCPPKRFDSDSLSENNTTCNGEEGTIPDYEMHPEVNSEVSDAATLEQRRTYKLELQKGIALFNRKPSKGIDFLISTKKIGSSPEAVALFLKNTAGLNETIIGMDFGQAIRFFLRGFRLPGEAQKIDRIMEKFAERYCKCNPNSFTSAETAYVLAYSVIMLNTDAHNNMVKDKMTKADFIRNNRGINDGKDLPEEYLGAIYDHIVRNEIKMNADSSAPQSKQANSLNKLLGLDGILNLVWKQTEEKPLGANGVLIKHIQEQFKAKSGKSESAYYAVADAAILRFMVEVCWGPMLAAFSMTLDQSDDKVAISQCLQGFRHAVHITAVMGMQTQRDAFMTTVAKFTNLHCAADMKQKNVDAVKAMISIAIEDGNSLQEAWEHILTCLSRFEHLQLLGEGAPSDASFLTTSNSEADEKAIRSLSKKKGTLQNPAVAAVVRGGSYDSTTVGVNFTGLVTPEQMNSFISNLNLLDQIGNFELNHIFAHSQRLNSEAIVAFVKALCKVSMSELQSPTDPRVFSLTKIVEVACTLLYFVERKGQEIWDESCNHTVDFLFCRHYNMNRIRLVWSRIWSVLSDFFVSVGLSENLSVAIFVMDSLRQLAMKFLEREELANYNFQNEFLRPFVIVMQKSSSAEIRELIVRCLSQMVLSRVSNVKSGWKSVFMVFTTAAADERKNIVLLAFETMEKIVREYFPYITETETVTFTDCVRCLITFTNSRFNSDVSLNAIAFLRFCAVKLADGGVVSNEKNNIDDSSVQVGSEDTSDGQTFTDKDDNTSFWVPLLTGLSKLTSDPRSAVRKSALEVLFNILKDHGLVFSRPFWNSVFKSVVFPLFNFVHETKETQLDDDQSSPASRSSHHEGSMWDSETSTVAVQCLVDLIVTFFDVLRSQLPGVVSILAGFLRRSGQEDEWGDVFLALEQAVSSSLPGFLKLLRTMDRIEVPETAYNDVEIYSDHGLTNDGPEITDKKKDELHWILPLSSVKKEELAARTPLVLLYAIVQACARQISLAYVLVLGWLAEQ